MKKNLLSVCFALLATLAVAQMNDAQAIAWARPYVARFAPEALSHSPQVDREALPDAPGGPTQFTRVDFGEVIVTLVGDGSLAGFANFGANAPVTGGANRYADDETSWRALESMLGEFEFANGLTRKKLERVVNDMRPNEVNFTMAARPYGYDTDSGNVAYAVVHRVTGKIISLYVGSGWQYEPPNTLVSEETAINSVRLAHGGDVGDWSVRMRYTTIADGDAPEYARQMRSSKTMRLHYVLHSPPIGTAFVDSVTGDIVHFGSTDDLGDMKGPGSIMGASEGGSARSAANDERAGGPWQAVAFISAALLAAGGAVVFLRRQRA